MHEFEQLGHMTPQQDLDALDRLAQMARQHWFDHVPLGPVAECIEVGSWTGGTALVLSQRFARVFCVDTWQGTPSDRTRELAVTASIAEADPVFRAFCRNAGDRLYKNIIPCRGTSAQYAAIWPRKVPLVFIDADHNYEAVRQDILDWRPHVAPGGILCGHDFGVFEGVDRAVQELIPAEHLHRDGFCLWWTRIPG